MCSEIDERKFVGTYQVTTKDFRDTLWINENYIYQHVYYNEKSQDKFYQKGVWKPTVNGYFDLTDWKTDSISFGGADILPLFYSLSSTIKFAYPLVTSNDLEYKRKI